MKVLLVNPFQVSLVNKKGRIYNRTWPPLELANCGAILEEAGINVAILDAFERRGKRLSNAPRIAIFGAISCELQP